MVEQLKVAMNNSEVSEPELFFYIKLFSRMFFALFYVIKTVSTMVFIMLFENIVIIKTESIWWPKIAILHLFSNSLFYIPLYNNL